jgi:hypothetical protein
VHAPQKPPPQPNLVPDKVELVAERPEQRHLGRRRSTLTDCVYEQRDRSAMPVNTSAERLIGPISTRGSADDWCLQRDLYSRGDVFSGRRLAGPPIAQPDSPERARTSRVEPKVMQVLECLVEKPGEVVSRDELVARVWPESS